MKLSPVDPMNREVDLCVSGVCCVQDHDSDSTALCVKNRSAFEHQHNHLLHCLEKTTVRIQTDLKFISAFTFLDISGV